MRLAVALLLIQSIFVVAQPTVEEGRGLGIPEGAGDALWDQTTLTPTGSGMITNGYGGLPLPNRVLLAEDFAVPSGLEWNITNVRLSGFLSGGSPNDVNALAVAVFADAGGVPGTEIWGARIEGSGSADTNLVFPETLTLQSGTYWISIYGVFDASFGPPDRWNWSLSNDLVGSESMFIDEGDVFGAGLTSWVGAASIIGIPPSTLFALDGTSQVPIPTLGEWGMIVFVVMLIGAALFMSRRQRLAHNS